MTAPSSSRRPGGTVRWRGRSRRAKRGGQTRRTRRTAAGKERGGALGVFRYRRINIRRRNRSSTRRGRLCGTRRPQVGATSSQNGACEGSPDSNQTRDSNAAAEFLADPAEAWSPRRARKSTPRDAAAEADSNSAVQLRFPALSCARTLVNSGKEEKSTVATVAAISREKSAAVTPPTASSTPSPSTAEDVVESKRPSRPTVAGIAAVASSDVHFSGALGVLSLPTNQHPKTQPQ